MRIVDPRRNLLEFRLSYLKQELLQKIFIILNKSTKEEILKRTGDKLQEPFDEKIRPGFFSSLSLCTMQA